MSSVCRHLETLLTSNPDLPPLPNPLSSALDALRREATEASEALDSSTPSPSSLNARLRVRVELETERRARLEAALEDAERRAFAASREKERAQREAEENKAAVEAIKVKRSVLEM